jgi:hypothetical protein
VRKPHIPVSLIGLEWNQSAFRRLDHSHRESSTLGRRLACERFKLAGKRTGFSVDSGSLPANSGSCAQMRLRGHHLGAAATLEGGKYSDAAAAGVADRHDAVFDGDAALALALFT